MQNFAYTYIDSKTGRTKKGQMEAMDEEKVRQSIKAEGQLPISITIQNNVLTREIKIDFLNRVRPRDLSIFCRQIVSIISSGVSVVNALDMLAEQTENKPLREGIKETQILVEKGETLSNAMRQQPKVFPEILINMVGAGETTGSLENSFSRMATHFEKISKIKSLILKAMIYPIILGGVSILVVAAMLLFILPSFSELFLSIDVEMPAYTQRLLDFSAFITGHWLILLMALAGIIAGINYYKKSPDGKYRSSQIAMKLPLVGKLVTKSICANFTRTMSTLVGSGVPMVEAVDITARTLNNEVIRRVLLDAKEDIARGVPLSVKLQSSGVFPPMVYHMTKIGEETGNVEEMLGKVADYYEEEVEIGTETLTAAMEPMIIIVLAIVVIFMIMSIMDPMMSMYEGLDNLQ